MNMSYQTLKLKKNEILEELNNVKNNYLKDFVYKMQLSYVEIIDTSSWNIILQQEQVIL